MNSKKISFLALAFLISIPGFIKADGLENQTKNEESKSVEEIETKNLKSLIEVSNTSIRDHFDAVAKTLKKLASKQLEDSKSCKKEFIKEINCLHDNLKKKYCQQGISNEIIDNNKEKYFEEINKLREQLSQKYNQCIEESSKKFNTLATKKNQEHVNAIVKRRSKTEHENNDYLSTFRNSSKKVKTVGQTKKDEK